ncbi:beta-lactamase [Plectosphaerella cucumerina]|uniref:Beta-lactamase n=1 Tax=Plectosphaerella cucumerina TaxID=40658 RepID=A0A8K0TCP0_9PEZI|nr:beta-lactamase [Plectosphaerella cucumerina]
MALCTRNEPLRVESFVNVGIGGFRTVSSLIIGSQSAVLIDMPLTLPAANELAGWIKNTTDKPLVAAFATHHHVDHYLGASAILAGFPEAVFYATQKNVDLIAFEVGPQTERQRVNLGPENISEVPAQPVAYNETFFTLSGHDAEPIQLLSNLVFDTVDGTMFWIPSMKTLIAGDSVYHRSMHPWMADTVTTALSDAWLQTLSFIATLQPTTIVPGHAGSLDFDARVDIEHTKSYISFFQTEVLAKGENALTPEEIVVLFDTKFPQEAGETGIISGMFLNNTAGRFGRNSTRLPDFIDLTVYNSTEALKPWQMGHKA